MARITALRLWLFAFLLFLSTIVMPLVCTVASGRPFRWDPPTSTENVAAEDSVAPSSTSASVQPGAGDDAGANTTRRPPDPVILPIPCGQPYFVNVTTIRGGKERQRHHRGGHLVITNHPLSVIIPSSVQRLAETEAQRGYNSSKDDSVVPNGEEVSLPLQRTSVQAGEHRCDVAASNGGPFDRDGWGTGPTVVDGRLVRTRNSNLFGTTLVGIGTAVMGDTSDGTPSRHWILGSYQQIVELAQGRDDPPLASRGIWNFVTGFQWLVYRGKSLADNSHNPTGADRAPRTAVGLDRDSNLLLLVVDGCEHCLRRRGPTLEELAEMMIDHGALYAINMDGGGSSTMVTGMDYQVINRPTCLDIPAITCQRPVVSVLCVSSTSSTSTTFSSSSSSCFES